MQIIVRQKLLSILGIVVGIGCLGLGTHLYPGGFDWNRDFISTLLRGPAGPSRNLSDVGVLFFCLSLGMVFVRLARVSEFSRYAKVIRIGGIGSMVYASLTITPMHDLMVTISLVFLLAAVIPLTLGLYENRKMVLFVAGSVALLVLIASACVYYTGRFAPILPWAQRFSFFLIALWLIWVDLAFDAKAAAADR